MVPRKKATPPTRLRPLTAEDQQARETQFRNVDLVVASNTDLSALLHALQRETRVLFIMYSEMSPRRSYISAELNRTPKNAGSAIRSFAMVLARLPTKAARQCARAQTRVMNIGYDSGYEPRSFIECLTVADLRAATSVGAAIEITIYAADETRARAGQALKRNRAKARLVMSTAKASMHDGDPSSVARVGYLHWSAGNKSSAIRLLRRAVKLAPAGPERTSLEESLSAWTTQAHRDR